MAALLYKFRIDYSDLIVFTDINDPPKELRFGSPTSSVNSAQVICMVIKSLFVF